MGESAFEDVEGNLPPDIEMPKLDEILTAEEFRELLVQDKDDLGKHGEWGWIVLLGYSVRAK